MIEKLLVLLLFAAAAHLSSAQNGADLQCLIAHNDNSTCIFTDINDPYDLIRKLPDANNPKAGQIKTLKFFKCFFDYLFPQMMRLFPNIEQILAPSQYLTRIDRNDLGDSKTLLKLNVSYNRIHRLSRQFSLGLTALQNLDISHNILERIMPEAFKYNVNLKYLNMSHNQIVSLDREFFDSVRSAVILKLNDNKITEITGNFDHYVSIIQELHLQNNFLLSIDPILVRNPPYLDLSLNKLQALDLSASRTVELKVVGNELKNLKIGRRMQKLDASENRLYLFRIDADSTNNNMTHLNLSYIKMRLTDEKLLIDFRKFDKLQVLDLSDNNLITFDIKDLAYDASRTIRTLNFRNSHIRTLKNWERIGRLLPSLREINLADNIFDCGELERMIPQLQKLNVTLPGFDAENNETFVSRSCNRMPPSYINDIIKPSQTDYTVVVWCFMAFFLIGVTVTGIVFINKKLSVFEKLYGAIKVTPYKMRGSKLLDEEKANDTENSF